MCTGGRFPGLKRGRGVTLTTHPHLVQRSRMSRSYTYPPSAFIACSGTALAFYFIKNVRNGHDMITSTNGYLKRLFDGKTLKRGHPRTPVPVPVPATFQDLTMVKMVVVFRIMVP